MSWRCCQLLFALLCGGLASTACGKDEGVGATPDASVAPGKDAAPEVGPPVEAGPKLRTVSVRNPFGNTDKQNNLLVDGDFEWTSGFGQYGWRAQSGISEANLERETGGLCRSGVSCGLLRPGISFLGYATAAPNKAMEARVWTKPPVPDCLQTSVTVLQCTTTLVTIVATVLHETAVPGEDGWCLHKAVVPAMDLQPCLFVSSYASPGQVTLIDEASLLAVDTATAPTTEFKAPTAADKSKMEAALRVLLRPRLGRAVQP